MMPQARLKFENGILVEVQYIELLYSKCDKVFWTKEYYVSTIGNITEKAIKKYIMKQAEESEKRFKKYCFIVDR